MKHTPLKRFFGHQSGSVILLVGLSFLFLVGIAGAGYDLGRQQLVRQKLQQASDAGALAAASIKCEAEPCTDRLIVAGRYFNLNFPATYLGVNRPYPTITVPMRGSITVEADSVVSTQFVGNLSAGLSQMNSKGKTVVGTGSGATNFDVLLVLDVSGSMNEPANAGSWNSKLMALRTAADTLANKFLSTNPVTCASDPTLAGCNRIGVVSYSVGAPPFYVNKEYACNCMSYQAPQCCGSGCSGGGWGGGEGNATDIFGKKFFAGLGKGLVSDARAQSCSDGQCANRWVRTQRLASCSAYGRPMCTNNPISLVSNCNTPPNCVPFKTPEVDQSGLTEIYGCFPDSLGDNMTFCEEQVRRVLGKDCDWHIQYISWGNRPLAFTHDINLVRANFWNLSAQGKTNSGDAFRVAMDPAGIPAEATGMGAPVILLPAARPREDGVAKIVIWLTDGNNTASVDPSRTTFSCDDRYPQSCSGRINFGDDSRDGTLSNQQTSVACNTLKSAGQNTVIYTIGFGAGINTSLLRQCASEPKNSHFFVAPDNTTLEQAFQEIFDDINKIRITE